MKTYGGAYCDEREAIEVTDTLDTLNADLSGAVCVVIYDEATAAQDGENNQQNNAASGLGVLTYSQACNVHLFPSQCPDPYGKLHSAARASAHTMSVAQSPRKEMVKTVFSWLLMLFGIILICASALVYFRKMKALDASKEANNNKKKGFFAFPKRGEAKKKTADTNSDEKKPGFMARIKGKLSRSSSNI